MAVEAFFDSAQEGSTLDAAQEPSDDEVRIIGGVKKSTESSSTGWPPKAVESKPRFATLSSMKNQ